MIKKYVRKLGSVLIKCLNCATFRLLILETVFDDEPEYFLQIVAMFLTAQPEFTLSFTEITTASFTYSFVLWFFCK